MNCKVKGPLLHLLWNSTKRGGVALLMSRYQAHSSGSHTRVERTKILKYGLKKKKLCELLSCGFKPGYFTIHSFTVGMHGLPGLFLVC